MVCNLQFSTIVVKNNHESLHFTKKKKKKNCGSMHHELEFGDGVYKFDHECVQP
jgi:hypothetical protein